MDWMAVLHLTRQRLQGEQLSSLDTTGWSATDLITSPVLCCGAPSMTTRTERAGTSRREAAQALPCLFAFLEHGGVEPTNNAAERALRSVVLHRKISGQIKGGTAWRDRR